jgi:hypothetical protein
MPRRDRDDDDDFEPRRPARRRDEDDEDDVRPAKKRRRYADDDGQVTSKRTPPSNGQKVLGGVGSGLIVVIVLICAGLRIYGKINRANRAVNRDDNPPAPVVNNLPAGTPLPGPGGPVPPAEAATQEATIANLEVGRDGLRRPTVTFDYEFADGARPLDYCAVVTVPGRPPMVAELGRLTRDKDSVSVSYTDFLAGSFPKGTAVYLGQRPRGSQNNPKRVSNVLTVQ